MRTCRPSLRLSLALGAVVSWGTFAAPQVFYVSTAGSDAWKGRLEAPNGAGTDGPFATLLRARDAVREFKASFPDRDVRVLLRGGTYCVEQTVVFGLQDGGTGEQAVTYAAYPGEKPVLSGGVPVTGWRKVETTLPGLPEAAQGKIWAADVAHARRLRQRNQAAVQRRDESDWGWRFFTLFAGERRLPRARGPGFKLLNLRGELPERQLRFPKGAMGAWAPEGGCEIVVIPAYCWTMNILPVEAIDVDTRVATTRYPATYGLYESSSHPEQAWVENAFPVLDSPGEWVLDGDSATLYLWPTGSEPPSDIVAPVLAEIVRVEGDIDYDGPRDTPVRNLSFRGLTFTHGDRFPWHGRSGWGIQHDWELFDSPTAMLRFRGAEDCSVEDCRFAFSGHSALRWDLHGIGNRVVGNVIEHVGGCGIVFCGYGPGTKDVNRDNQVLDNYIHHVGEAYWHSPAVFLWQSGGNRVAHNHIHNTPYTGIVVSCRAARTRDPACECARTIRWDEVGDTYPKASWEERERFMHGRENVIERNDIHSVMEVLGDGNCIYVSGTGGGNVIRENYCHDVWGRSTDAAIRTDNDQHDTLIERNIITRIHGHACGICNKGGNRVLQNIIADLRPTSPHLGCLVLTNYVPAASTMTGNVFYVTRPGIVPLRDCGPHPGLSASETGGNLFWSVDDPRWAEDYLAQEREAGRETGSRVADPMFVDPETDDFRFRLESPALSMGLKQPVAIADIGLRPPYRTRSIGRPLRTIIQPESCRLNEPVEVRMSASTENAEIRYTLDGSRPTRQALRYSGPFTIAEPGVVRARSFAEGATDVNEARSIFSPPYPPVVDDFEGTPVGDRPAHATVFEDNSEMTIRVAEGGSASGKRCLKFTDGPGQRYAFDPHMFYETGYTSGTFRLSFDVRVDAGACLNVQWRQYSVAVARFAIGPDIHVGPAGKLAVGRKLLCELPLNVWAHLEVTGGLGPDSDGTFALSVRHPGLPAPRQFTGLAYRDAFRLLEWTGFIATGEEDAAFFVDNVRLGPVPAPRTQRD